MKPGQHLAKPYGTPRRPELRVVLAAFVASLAAGPLALIFLTLMSAAIGDLSREPAAELIALLGVATLSGFMFAILPNLLGSVGMFVFAHHHPPARSLGWWLAAGAVAAFLLCAALDIMSAGPIVVLPFCAVGACCAGICHLIARPD